MLTRQQSRLISFFISCLCLSACAGGAGPDSEVSSADNAPLSKGANDLPVIPLNTSFWSYWDHYWTTWLPDHPVYEMIEATVYEGENEKPLIRLILSEREGDSAQTFYLNDLEAVASSQANAHYTDMDYRKTGTPGQPQSLSIGFTDRHDARIDWSISFPHTATMQANNDELTPSTHSVGDVLLLAYSPRNAMSYEDSVRINGVEFAHQGPNNDALPGIRSWYNADYHSAVVVFGVQRFTAEADSLSSSWGRTFQAEDAGRIYTSNLLGPENFIEMVYTEEAGLERYSHYSHGRSLDFEIVPTLPSMAKLSDGGEYQFTAGFGEGYAKMTGTLYTHRVDNVIVLEWMPDHPAWAVSRPFYSVLQVDDEGYLQFLTDDRSRVFGDTE